MKIKKIPLNLLGAALAAGIFFSGCKSAAPSQEEEEIPEDVVAKPALLFTEIQDVFPGVAHVFLVKKSDGSLWGCGYNRSGQLGIGDYVGPDGDRYPRNFVPVHVGGASGNAVTGVKTVAVGENHSLMLKNDGTLWVAGENKYGELGLGGTEDKVTVFTQVALPGADGNPAPVSGIIAVAAGIDSSFFIKEDGSLWAAGYNHYGELGFKNRIDYNNVFAPVPSAGNDVAAVASGSRHTAILKRDGSLWIAGANHYGQLGLGGEVKEQTVFVKVDAAGTDNKAVGAGDYHTVLLKHNGEIWAAGYNEHGQLGLGDVENRSIFTMVKTGGGKGGAIKDGGEITIGGNNSIFVKRNGGLWGTGDNTFGQLGQGNAGLHHSSDVFLEIKTGNSSKSTIKKAAAGSRSVYILMEDGALWGMGSNRYGQLNGGYELNDLSNPSLLLSK